MFYEEIRIKQILPYISFCLLRILYKRKIVLMATSVGTNAVVVTRVHCIHSKTSITRTLMARLPLMIRTHFLSPYEILPIKGLFQSFNYIQYTINNSNTDGSFTLDDSNYFLSAYELLPFA